MWSANGGPGGPRGLVGEVFPARYSGFPSRPGLRMSGTGTGLPCQSAAAEGPVNTAAKPGVPPPPGVSTQVRAAVLVAGAAMLASVVGGVGWGLLAPGESLLVVQPDQGSELTGESLHPFDALAIFVGIGLVIGVMTGLAAWRWVRMRGPIQLVGVLVGSVLGAWAMTMAGEAVAELRYPHLAHPPIGQIVTLAPAVEIWQVWLIQPLFALLVLLVAAAGSPGTDLGTHNSCPFGAIPENHSLPSGSDHH